MSTWTYRDSVAAAMRDVTGYHVETIEGSIGTIDEASNEAGAAYVVVDTSSWMFGRRRLIPAPVIERIDHDSRTAYVAMTRDQIKNAPDLEDTDRQEHSPYDRYYSSF